MAPCHVAPPHGGVAALWPERSAHALGCTTGNEAHPDADGDLLRPGRDDARSRPPGVYHDVEHVEWMERLDAFHDIVLAHPIERGHGKAARIDFDAFIHHRLQLPVDRQIAGEAVFADVRKA